MADCQADYQIVVPPKRINNILMYAKRTKGKEPKTEMSPVELKVEDEKFAPECKNVDSSPLTNRTPKTFRLGSNGDPNVLTELEWRQFKAKSRLDRGFNEWRKQAKLGPNRTSPFEKKRKPAVAIISPTPTQKFILNDLESHKIMKNVEQDKTWLRQRSRPIEVDEATTPPGQKITHGRRLLLQRLKIIKELEQAALDPSTGEDRESKQNQAGDNSASQLAPRSETNCLEEQKQMQQDLFTIQANLEKLNRRLKDLVMR